MKLSFGAILYFFMRYKNQWRSSAICLMKIPFVAIFYFDYISLVLKKCTQNLKNSFWVSFPKFSFHVLYFFASFFFKKISNNDTALFFFIFACELIPLLLSNKTKKQTCDSIKVIVRKLLFFSYFRIHKKEKNVFK